MIKAIIYIDLFYCLLHITYIILNIIWFYSNETLTIMSIALLLVMIIGYFFTLFFSLIVLTFTIQFLFSHLILRIITFLIEVLFIAVLSKNSVFRNIFGTGINRLRGVETKTLWYAIITTILSGANIIILIYSGLVKSYGSYPPTL